MKETKLLNCPFCGGEAVLESDIIGKGKELYYVSCKNDCVTQYGYKSTKDGAITAWNTRKPMERILERLEEKIEEHWDYYNDAKRTGNIRQMDYSDGCAEGLIEAIKIVKEEGGIE